MSSEMNKRSIKVSFLVRKSRVTGAMSSKYTVLDGVYGTSELPNLMEDFTYSIESTKKQYRSRKPRGPAQLPTVTDQAEMGIYVPPKVAPKPVEDLSMPSGSEPEDSTEEPVYNTPDGLDSVGFPLFALVNQQRFPLIATKRQAQRPPARPPPPIPQRAPTPGIPSRPLFNQPMSRQQQTPAPPDDQNRVIEHELFFQKHHAAIQRQQQTQAQQQSNLLGIQGPGIPRPMPGRPLQFANPAMSMTQIGGIPRSNTTQFYQGSMMNRPGMPMMMQRVIQSPQGQNQNFSGNNVIPYLNANTTNSCWSVMYEPSEYSNIPLILDRNDRSIKFTDKVERRTGITRQMRNWKTMNFENPHHYSKMFVSKDNRLDLNLQHASPAINLTLIEPNFTDFEHFHHPQFNASHVINRPMTITYRPEYDMTEEESTVVSPFLKDLRSLSGKRGTVTIIEHTSENPPFITNVGMCSRLIVYWHKATADDLPSKFDTKMHILEPEQTAPFIAQIPRNEPIPSLNNALYSVPVAEHNVSNRDFLLIKSMTKPVFYIRPFNHIYCAGFLEPRQVVMRPATKTAQNFHMDFIKAILINIFRGTEQYPKERNRIQVTQIQNEFFPNVNEPKLRSVLHHFAKFYREKSNGYWEKRPDVSLDQQFQMIEITPEKVCKYQSMQWGLWRLRKSGVSILTRSKRVYQQIQRLKGEVTKCVAEKIEIELMKTPWARTDNFSKAFQGHAVQIEHTESGESIMRSKSRRQKADSSSGSSDSKDSNSAAQRRQLAGTESDLRSLTLRELREKLLALGVPSEKIDEKSRWDQVDLLRQLANRQVQDGDNSEIAQQYSRGPRNDYALSLQAYKKQYQATFENNLNFINSSSTQNDTNFDDGNLLDDIGLQMMREDQERDDDDDDDTDLEAPGDEQQTHFVSKGDPPELIPNGVCTSPTRIDWAALGFPGAQMRPVAKIIKITCTDDGPLIEVTWKRTPHQIEALKRNPTDVYSEIAQKSPSSSEDLQEYILKVQRKQLQEKLRRTRQAARQKGQKTPVQSYLTVKHQIPFVNDNGGTLTFHLTPEIIKKVTEASEKFAQFEKHHSRSSSSSSRKKKMGSFSGADTKSDESDNDAPEVVQPTSTKMRLRRQNPVVLFNECINVLLARLLQRPGDEFFPFKKPILRKDVPDYHLYVQNPICFEDIQRKANSLQYTTISQFYSDIKLIETNCRAYNTGRNENLLFLVDKLMTEFNKELSQLRDELEEKEQEIDPVLRQTPPTHM